MGVSEGTIVEVSVTEGVGYGEVVAEIEGGVKEGVKGMEVGDA